MSSDCYPERYAGGFTRFDGTIEFYVRIHALLDEVEDPVILDFGAGRGGDVDSGVVAHQRLRDFRQRAYRVIGVDVDEAVLSNPWLTDAFVTRPGEPLPLDDASVDVVVADHVFEHLESPGPVARELGRVLRAGGWICARTPNRWGYIAIAARGIPNALHAAVLKHVQPLRNEADIFPTAYRLNTERAIRACFPASEFEHVIYGWEPEPAYGTASVIGQRSFSLLRRMTPERLRPVLLVFLRKRISKSAPAGSCASAAP